MNLYQLSGEIAFIAQTLDNEDFNDETKARFIQGYLNDEQPLKAKLDNYAALIRSLEARAAARATEAKRMMDLSRSDTARVEKLKSILLWWLDNVAGISKVETDRFCIRAVTNGGKAPVIVPENEEEWPEAFVHEVVHKTLDKEAIREALLAGAEIPGCSLGERGRSIRIG